MFAADCPEMMRCHHTPPSNIAQIRSTPIPTRYSLSNIMAGHPELSPHCPETTSSSRPGTPSCRPAQIGTDQRPPLRRTAGTIDSGVIFVVIFQTIANNLARARRPLQVHTKGSVPGTDPPDDDTARHAPRAWNNTPDSRKTKQFLRECHSLPLVVRP